ncbi:immunity protein TriTu family protein [Conchiformibius steedae]|uniref:Uncharacterized protein n=1 Tax=Conchiformibius steedae TaxID=153493 RepID=A0A3P2A6Q2_9NEIS|nr:hypothetical protein [Conchiformibius steedae]RRD90556.1 hypothetical protein EII21_04575 [Conchiformibius steedae]
MLDKFLSYFFDNYKNSKYDNLEIVKENEVIQSLFLRLDNDVYLSQITFWDNLMYSCQIYYLKADKYILNEDIQLQSIDEIFVKFNIFVKILKKFDGASSLD